MDKKQVKEHVENGYLHVRMLLEILGNPKEHVEKTMHSMIANLKTERDIKFVKEEIGQAEETQDKLWGIYCEAEVLIKNVSKLSWLAFNFVPADIEILAPTKLTIKDKELTDFVSDIVAQLHEFNTKRIELTQLNSALLKNMNAMTRNAILISLLSSPKSEAEIGKLIGLSEKDIMPVLAAMEKEKRVKKEAGKYRRL